MVIMTKYGSQDNVALNEFYCDTLDDRAEINPKDIQLGTRCIVLENDNIDVYIADSKKQWHKL